MKFIKFKCKYVNEYRESFRNVQVRVCDNEEKLEIFHLFAKDSEIVSNCLPL